MSRDGGGAGDVAGQTADCWVSPHSVTNRYIIDLQYSVEPL